MRRSSPGNSKTFCRIAFLPIPIDSSPRRRPGSSCWIPAFAGMTTVLIQLDVELFHLPVELGVVADELGLDLLRGRPLTGLSAFGGELLHHRGRMHAVAHDAVDLGEYRLRHAGGRVEPVAVRELVVGQALLRERRQVRRGRY